MKIFLIALLVLLTHCAQKPSCNCHNKYQIGSFTIQGHRGARGLFPENTWPAFQKALELNMDFLELDVVLNKDGQLIVSHDAYMSSEICLDPQGKIIPSSKEKTHNLFKMNFAQIQKYDCGSKPHPRFPGQKKMKISKPLLSQIIDQAEAWQQEHKKSIQYNIELKSEKEGDGIFHPAPQKFAQKLFDMLRRKGILERTVVQSFDVRCLQAFKKINKQVLLSLLVENNLTIEENIKKLGFKPDIYSCDYTFLDAEKVAQLHEQNILVIPWTVNEKEDMQYLRGIGVDGIITDYPNKAQFLIKNKL